MTDTILLVLRAIIAQQEYKYIYIYTYLGIYVLRYIYIAAPRLKQYGGFSLTARFP